MKKALKKQAALVMLSAAVTAQTGFPGYAAATVTGSWQNENGTWKFYSPDQKSYTGWIKTNSGWYYLNPEDGKMVTGWQKIDGFWYYFDTAEEGIEGRMHTGWYKNPANKWFFFDNGSGTSNEGHLVIGWHWIDGYCYYFAAESSDQPGIHGAMYSGTTTPDGYPTNADGQWLQDDKPVHRENVGYNTKTTSSASSSGSGSGSGSSSSSGSSSGSNSSSGKDNSSDSGNDSNNTPSTPDTPNTPDTPDTPVNPDTPSDAEEYQYLLMNIPYADFYAAEIENNDVDVDVVSSATKSKPKAGNLVGGSYHVNSDGSDISGVVFPVKIKKGTDLSKFTQVTDEDSFSITVTLRGTPVKTTYTGKDALFERPDYSYYVLSEIPSYYKEVSVDAEGNLSFGEAQTDLSEEATVSASLQTESNYGDYQLSFEGLSEIIGDDDQVYGVVLHTKEDVDYGLRHLENIWLRTNLAWSTGVVTTTHGNTLAPEHYKSMMGKTITGLTYFTNNGIADITLEKELYVPYKFTHENFGVTAASASAGSTTITGMDSLPEGFDATYTFTDPSGKNTEAFTVDANTETITWSGSLAAGTYTLTVTDESETYADLTTTFVLSTAKIPVQATANSEGVWSLTAAEEATEDQVACYLASITSVSVNGKDYAASGRGAVQIIDPNTGRIKTEATSGETAIFTKGETYELVVTATGYDNPLTFTMVAGETPKPEGVEVEGTVSKATTGFTVNGSYQAKLRVVVNEDGTVASVTDNGTEPGANSTWWNTATAIFKSLIGKNKNQIDAVDTISGATASSRIIKSAVKSVLPDVADEKPQAPKLTAADHRTKLLYAATDAAELSVEAEDGTVVKYTVDGSDPTAAGSSVKTAENGIISVEPDTNEDTVLTVKAVAVKNGVASEIAEKELQFMEILEAQSGLKVYQGSATVNTPSGSPYTAKLKVTVSEGKIVKVEDNETKISDDRDAAFWTPYLFSEHEEGISAKFAGKDLAGMLNAKTVPEDSEEFRVDAITGATVSSDAAKYAVIDALRSEPIDESDETVVAPEVSAAWGSLVTRVSNGIRLTVSAADNTTVYYTTDGSDPTQDDETLSYGSATIYANNSKSGKVKVKFAAFDENGNRSKIVSVWCVFTDDVPEVLYQTGTYEGSAGDVEATVTVERGYGSRPIISTIELDEDSQEEYANFLPELIAEITYKQSTKITPLAAYDADLQKQVLEAVEAALENALSAEVLVSLNPNNQIYSGYYGKYEFDEAPEITLSCGIKDAEIYYYITDTNTTGNPDTATWTLYDDAFKPEFTKEEGGTVYIQLASTRDGGETWLNTKQISITYKEKPDDNAFMIGGVGYSSFTKALAAVEEGDEIVLNQDLSLDGTVTMPNVSFSITSAEGECYKVESKNALELNGDLEISNVDWCAETYLNGYDFTAGEGVYQNSWRFSYTKLYAGSKKGSVEADPTITISSGQFDIYGCAENAELTGNVTISVDGTAMVNIIGAGYGSTLNGDIDVTINGDNGAMLASFIGRQSSAEVSGDLTLTLEGKVKLYAWGGTYQAIQYDTDNTWGTLDLTNAKLDDDDKERFEGFETVLDEEEEASKIDAATIAMDADITITDTTAKTEDTTITDEIVNEDETEADQKSDETTEDTSKDETSEDSKNESSDDQKTENTENTNGNVSEDEKTDDADADKSEDEKIDDADADKSEDEKIDDADADKSEDKKTEDANGDKSEDEKTDDVDADKSEDEKTKETDGGVSNDENTEESGGNASNDQTSEESGSDSLEEKTSEEQ